MSRYRRPLPFHYQVTEPHPNFDSNQLFIYAVFTRDLTCGSKVQSSRNRRPCRTWLKILLSGNSNRPTDWFIRIRLRVDQQIRPHLFEPESGARYTRCLARYGSQRGCPTAKISYIPLNTYEPLVLVCHSIHKYFISYIVRTHCILCYSTRLNHEKVNSYINYIRDMVY